jgi:hypothetical protein
MSDENPFALSLSKGEALQQVSFMSLLDAREPFSRSVLSVSKGSPRTKDSSIPETLF